MESKEIRRLRKKLEGIEQDIEVAKETVLTRAKHLAHAQNVLTKKELDKKTIFEDIAKLQEKEENE